MKVIYLDYNATTPIADEVAEAMLPFLKEHFGNPSSTHWYGIEAKKGVDNARRQVAEFLGCGANEIIFTSGGTESNNYAIKGTAFALKDKGRHIITSAIEHPAVLEVCRFLESEEFEVTYLPVDEYGMVNLNDVLTAVRPSTILITIMHANNEVGTIQPIEDIARLAKARGIVFHTDAAQSAGKIPMKVDELGVDLLSLAGHKLYAPKGIGALYIRRGTKLTKQIHGANHEFNLRAGTENVLEIVGLGTACSIAERDLNRIMDSMKRMRDLLYQGLIERLPNLRLNGHPQKRLPNTLCISFPNIEANTLLSELTEVAASAGAACHSDEIEVSHVLEAMNVPLEYAMGTIRLSTGRHTTIEEIDATVQKITEAVGRLTGEDVSSYIPQAGEEIKLTRFTHGLGCACKLRPQVLERILRKLPVISDENVLVGIETADDAGVYKIDDERALVQTVDFFTPIVDDPYQFGAIAAANSLSDIYAMGAKPLFALNIVGFPSNRLPVSVLEAIMKGAQDKAEEASIFIIGGHTVEDTEPKFGLAVTGIVSLDGIWKNKGMRPGDALVLTKPLGTGILSTAMKRGLADEDTIRKVIEVMVELNKAAADAARNYRVHACTDVTGFGMMGHLREMVIASGISVEVYSDSVPLIDGAEDFAIAGVIPGGTLDNSKYVEDEVEWGERIPLHIKYLLCDAQTSGGLLIAVPKDDAGKLVDDLRGQGISRASIIGEVLPASKKLIFVR